MPIKLYQQLTLSLLVGNGDAHLKNFAILYDSADGPFELSPIYDVVCTRPYNDHSLALSLSKTREYPGLSTICKLGQAAGVSDPKRKIEKLSDAVTTTLNQRRDLLETYPEIARWIRKTRDQVMRTSQTGWRR